MNTEKYTSDNVKVILGLKVSFQSGKNTYTGKVCRESYNDRVLVVCDDDKMVVGLSSSQLTTIRVP